MKNHQASLFSCAGRKGSNQDSLLFEQLDDGTVLLAIADGMGGHVGGQVASELAIATVKSELAIHSNVELSLIFEKVQKAFISKVEQEPELKKMGSTLTVCVISGTRANIAHVGDTRLYHLRNSGLVSRTVDQTELQQLIAQGVITKARAKNYHRKNILLSVMSAYRDYELQVSSFDLLDGDRLLLLTDGAYSLMSKVEIRDLSLQNTEASHFVDSLKYLIESREIKDDYTALAFEFSGA